MAIVCGVPNFKLFTVLASVDNDKLKILTGQVIKGKT